MALIKCKECGTEISNKATACVKCGAPIAKHSGAEKFTGGVVTFAVGVTILWGCFHFLGAQESKDSSSPQDHASASCSKDDLQCLGDKGVVAAGVYCPRYIEQLATHSVKWTDGTFEMKFSRFRWKDEANGVITYIGDKAEFQNGFGAYTPVIYQCDLASDDKTVLDARVTEGRLPPN